MTIDQLQAAVARSLNSAIDIPLVAEGSEQLFFEALVRQVWERLPESVKRSVVSVALFIEADQLVAVELQLFTALKPLLKTLLWWRSDSEQVTQQVCSELMVLSRAGEQAGMSAKPV